MKNDLIERTFDFSNNVIDLVELLPLSIATKVVSYQIIKSGTSVGANYRSAQKARSDREFVSKIQIVLEEIDETNFWLQIIEKRNWINSDLLKFLLQESKELTAICITILVNKKKNSNLNRE